ncbi:MAG: tryptophan--tRNA ligase [Candidatus Moranbacteria bacterium]|nr:tryptophan--tRNA ligase [Candidatus Moranbacteria bacterium]
MRQRLFSGIQPSGNLHLGNYLGAIRQWIKLQDEYDAIFCVVDLHAITVSQDPEALRKKTLEIAKMYLAAGIDPAKATLFIQSHVIEHSEFQWILNTIARNGDLTKMTQFKDKAGVVLDLDDIQRRIQVQQGIEVSRIPNDEVQNMTAEATLKLSSDLIKSFKESFNSVGVGLFDYPVLMAADILLYDTSVVPVGEDQLQHVELTRTLARRFNERFGETLVVPEAVIQKEGARIMGLDDPMKKMSKSAASEYNFIALTDDADTVRKKIKKAVTDSGSEIIYSDEKPALQNLINIYALLSEESAENIQKKYAGKGYGDFKADLAEVVVNFLTPFQERLKNISDDEALAILHAGADKARVLAQAKMKIVKEKVGFVV